MAVTNSAALGLGNVTVGFNMACARAADDTAWCWGANFLGNGPGPSPVLAPTLAAGGLRLPFLGAASLYACGIDGAGAAQCWGGNASGGLGTGSTATLTAPTPVAGGLIFRSLAVNAGNTVLPHTCGVTTADQAWCWGMNSSGQLGASSSDQCQFQTIPDPFDCSLVPIQVSGGQRFLSVSVGTRHSCGVASKRAALYCWGLNFAGALGDGTTVDRPAPVAVLPPA